MNWIPDSELIFFPIFHMSQLAQNLCSRDQVSSFLLPHFISRGYPHLIWDAADIPQVRSPIMVVQTWFQLITDLWCKLSVDSLSKKRNISHEQKNWFHLTERLWIQDVCESTGPYVSLNSQVLRIQFAKGGHPTYGWIRQKLSQAKSLATTLSYVCFSNGEYSLSQCFEFSESYLPCLRIPTFKIRQFSINRAHIVMSVVSLPFVYSEGLPWIWLLSCKINLV